MILALYLLVIAAFLMFLNLRTRTSRIAKKLTYFGMWAAIIASIAVAVRSQL